MKLDHILTWIFNCVYFLAGNIFISRTSIPATIPEEGDDDEWSSSKVVFKIGKGSWNCVLLINIFSSEEIILSTLFLHLGDLGHVTRISSPQVEEGDSRFLANEVLQEVFDACLLRLNI